SIQDGINSNNNPTIAITEPSYIQSLMDSVNLTQLSFVGNISSTELNPGENIINNTIRIDIFLGLYANYVEADYEFSTNQLRNYSGDLGGNINKDGFFASDFSDSFIEGKFYGKNISSVGGIIKMQYPGGTTTNGTFSATR
ncbi:MAG: hypothetical protein DI602_06770, partial [Aliarcobacter butzleri]